MTEELFREATYSKTADAKVFRVMDEGVILDRTIFYPEGCLLYTSPSPRDVEESGMPSCA